MLHQNETKQDKRGDHIDEIVAHVLISSPGITDSELGQKVGMTRQSANRRRRSKRVKRLVSEALALPKDEFRRLMRQALKVLEGHLESHDPRISLTAALHLTKIAVPFVSIGGEGDSCSGDITCVTSWGDKSPPKQAS